MGKVYIFNAYPQMTRLSINDLWLSPWTPGVPLPGSSPAPYTPFCKQGIERSNLTTTNFIAFLNGKTNFIAVQIKSAGQSETATLKVPAQDNSTVDLWLYVFKRMVLLFDTKGEVKDYVPIIWDSSLEPLPQSSIREEKLTSGR